MSPTVALGRHLETRFCGRQIVFWKDNEEETVQQSEPPASCLGASCPEALRRTGSIGLVCVCVWGGALAPPSLFGDFFESFNLGFYWRDLWWGGRLFCEQTSRAARMY